MHKTIHDALQGHGARSLADYEQKHECHLAKNRCEALKSLGVPPDVSSALAAAESLAAFTRLAAASDLTGEQVSLFTELAAYSHASVRLPGRIDHGRWVVDCECDSGNIPLGRVARCFGCGAIHAVTYPRGRSSIEAAVLLRPQQAHRNWMPGETATDVRAENAVHGIEVTR